MGRVWWEEGEGEEEREQRRRGEQAARNARLMYNLQQQVTLLYCVVELKVLTLALCVLQVNSLQNEIQRLPSSQPGTIRRSKKVLGCTTVYQPCNKPFFPHTQSHVMHRLAAVHRAAVRTLQGFLSPLSPPVPSEMARLLQHLSLLCAQLEVGGEGTKIEQALEVTVGLRHRVLILRCAVAIP